MKEEKNRQTHDAVGLVAQLEQFDKEVVDRFAPTNGADEKDRVLNDPNPRAVPHHVYGKLAEPDFDEVLAQILRIRDDFTQTGLSPEEIKVYEDFTDGYYQTNALMRAAMDYLTAPDETTKNKARDVFMKTNIELFGAPDETTFRGLLARRLEGIKVKQLEGEAEHQRDHFLRQFGDVDFDNIPEPYQPKPETVKKVHDAVQIILEPLLKHIPADRDENYEYSPEELRDLWQEIIDQEFGDAARGWEVVISESKTGIDVSPRERKIFVPRNRSKGNMKQKEIRGLTAHELGVHFLRSVMGEQSALDPMRTGLADYYPAEEGLGKVFEQAINAEFSDTGELLRGGYEVDELAVDYYLIAGLSYFDKKSRGEITEIMDRADIFLKLDEDVDSVDLNKKDKGIYGRTQRIFRGTDELPLFKDLAYYNGSVKMWQYLDSIADDPNFAELFTLALYGKHDSTNPAHEDALYGSKPRTDWGAPEEELPATLGSALERTRRELGVAQIATRGIKP